MDIELRLIEIIERYNLSSHSEGKTNKRIYQEIRNVINTKLKNKRVAIRGGGEHTTKFVKDFGDLMNIVGIIDQDIKGAEERLAQYNIPIYSLEQISEFDFDIVVIGVYGAYKALKQELNNLGIEEVIDIYEELELRDCKIGDLYYNPYLSMIDLNNKYKLEQNEQSKSEILEELIIRYLEIRDIFSTQKYIKEYIQQGYSKSNEFSFLNQELDQLMEEIKSVVAKRNDQDIIWFWHDALCFDFVKYMPFMNAQRENGMFFENAFSSSSWTRNVYALIFEKLLEIDGYKKSTKENIIVKYLEEKGYKCIRIGGPAFETRNLSEFDYANEKILDFEFSTSQYYWQLLNEMMKTEQPIFALVHTMYETHMPICSPTLEKYEDRSSVFDRRAKDPNQFYERVKQTVLYLDDITKWLCEVLGEDMVKVFMSDHGIAMTYESRKWTSDTNHINFIITGKDIPKEKYHKLFELYNFYEVIKFIIERSNESLENIFMEEMLLQAQDIYSPNFIKEFCMLNREEYGVAYRGVQTLEDRYILLATGKEIYNVLPDEQTNHMPDERYKERVQYLRERTGTYFIDISKEPKFKHTSKLYESLKAKEGNK